MTSSPKNKVPPSLPAHHVGLVMGLTAGLGLYALYHTPEGRRFHQKMLKTVHKIRTELEEPLNSQSQNTYQELSQLVAYLKNSPPDLNSAPKTPFFANLKNHFFARNPKTPISLTLATKSSPRHFRQPKPRHH